MAVYTIAKEMRVLLNSQEKTKTYPEKIEITYELLLFLSSPNVIHIINTDKRATGLRRSIYKKLLEIENKMKKYFDSLPDDKEQNYELLHNLKVAYSPNQ